MPKFLNNIDLTKYELQNARIQNLASAPSSPVEGQIYYDTTLDNFRGYANGTWVAMQGGGSLTSVTAADSTITVAGTGTDPTVAVATGGITNTQINAAAAIVYSKLNLSGSIVNADISGSAAIAYSKLNLANSIVNADISSLSGSKINAGTVAATYLPALNSITAPTGSLSLNSQKITNLADPTASQDAATKIYVDSLVQGLDPKASVVAASGGSNVNVASAPATLDNITLTNGDRVLLKDQSTPSQNGIYVFNGAGSALTRATDMDAWTEVPGTYIWVEQGTANADTAWVCTSDTGGTLGTTAITFQKFANATTLTATAPVSISSNAITLTYTARLTNNGGSLDLASSVVTPGTYQSVTVDTYGRVTAGADLFSANGLAVRTASGSYTARTLTGTANQITVTNGDGVSGNPTISLPAGVRSNINAAGVYSIVGSGTTNSFTIAQATHGLGTSGNSFCDIDAVCWDISAASAVKVEADVSVNKSTGDVTFTFASSYTLTNYRFTIIGK